MKIKNILAAAIIPLMLVIAVSWTGKTVYTKAQKALDEGENLPPDIPERGDHRASLENMGATILLEVGEGLLLDFGEDYDWHIRVSDAKVISRQAGTVIPRGAQGLFRAHEEGGAVFSVNGYPTCLKDDPSCSGKDLEFLLHVFVRPSGS